MEEVIAKIKQFFGIRDRRLTIQEMAAVEICLYTVSGGAFGLFVRWMQKMIGYNEKSLPDPGFWNWAVIGIIAFAAFLLTKLVDGLKNRRWFLPRSHREVYSTDNRWLRLAAGTAAFLLVVGAILTLYSCGLEKNRYLLYVLSIFSVLTVIAHSVILSSANTGKHKLSILRTVSCAPMLFYSIWLISTYYANSINSVVWDYSLEIITVCVLIVTAFRIGGIYFFVFRPSKTIFLCCFSAFMCLMNIADGRLFGQQLMLVGSAIYYVVFAMIMIINMQEKDTPGEIAIEDGFDRG